MLIDSYGRTLDYLRLAVTDRCNLRCFYCMPEEGIQYLPKKQLLSYEEMLRLVHILAAEGVNKIRITGGEPFLRKDLISFLSSLSSIRGIQKINITSNGTLLAKHLSALIDLNITTVNLSLDTLDRQRFYQITRRDDLPKVMECLHQMLDMGFEVKLNMVVMQGKNIDDIVPMLELGKNHKLNVRYIEEMPFNGTHERGNDGFFAHDKILKTISDQYPDIIKLIDPPASTSKNYQVKDFKGSFGIIAAYSRTFCGGCNRLRLTPQGKLKTCLYDNGIFNLRDLIRAGASDQDILSAIQDAVHHKAKDGWEAERNMNIINNSRESMATIGG